MTKPLMAGDDAVVIEGLVKTFGAKTALDGISFTVPAGSITAVLGPNGAGKSTTLEICEGYQAPDRGTVRVLGLDPIRDGRALRPRIGVMLQEGGAWSGARAIEMLSHIAKLHAEPLDVPMLVDRLQLQECGRTPYRRLSGGQKQRLALAMAIVGRPELLFIDEPTAGLDPEARHRTWELLAQLRDAGVTVVLTSHNLDEVEQLADLLHLIDRGRLVYSGTPADVARTAQRATIEVTLDRSVSLEAVTSLVVELGDAASHDDTPRGHRISVPAGTETLSIVAAWCARHDLVPESMTLGRQRLEDAYLTLIGSKA